MSVTRYPLSRGWGVGKERDRPIFSSQLKLTRFSGIIHLEV